MDHDFRVFAGTQMDFLPHVFLKAISLDGDVVIAGKQKEDVVFTVSGGNDVIDGGGARFGHGHLSPRDRRTTRIGDGAAHGCAKFLGENGAGLGKQTECENDEAH